MKIIIYIISALSLILSSCATIFNGRTVDVEVYSDTTPLKFHIKGDTTKLYETPACLELERTAEPLILLAGTDSIKKFYFIESRLSPKFWFGNMFAGGFLGYIVDLTNQKRYTYPSEITLRFDSTDSDITGSYYTHKKILLPEQGLMKLKLTYPDGNHFFINKGSRYGEMFGFLGISAGIEYYLTDNLSINTDIGGLWDFFFPIPLDPIDFVDYGDREDAASAYWAIQAGSDYKNLHYKIGLQYNRTVFTKEHWDSLAHTKYQKFQNNLGLSLSASYSFTNNFALGVNYYPSMINWDNDNCFTTHYSHLLFIEMIISFELKRPGKYRNQ